MPRSPILLCTVILAATACSDSSTGPTTSNIPDVAALLAEMSPATVSTVVSLASPLAGAALEAAGTPDPATCPYSSSTGFFTCPSTTSSGLTFTEMFRLIDAAGNTQAKADGGTSAIESKTTVKGTLTSTPSSGLVNNSYTVDGSSDQTLSGIRTDKHTLNGTSTMHVSGKVQIGSALVPDEETVTQTATNLVLPNTKAGQKWPQSGTLALDLSENPNDPLVAEVLHMQMTFDGTSVVNVTITDFLGTRSCKVDLASSSGFQACL